MSEDESPTIRVLIAEDNALMRLGISTLLKTQPDIELVGEATDGAQAIEAYRRHNPTVLLLDLNMPVMHGAQVISNLCSEDPDVRILVLTHYDAEEDIFRAVKAGARGYLTKDFEGPQIIDAIRAVAAGERYLPTEIASRLADRMAQPSLSARESQVLERMATGLTNRQIAAEIQVADKTVGVYVSNVLAKLGAKTRTEAVTIARQKGLLSD